MVDSKANTEHIMHTYKSGVMHLKSRSCNSHYNLIQVFLVRLSQIDADHIKTIPHRV